MKTHSAALASETNFASKQFRQRNQPQFQQGSVPILLIKPSLNPAHFCDQHLRLLFAALAGSKGAPLVVVIGLSFLSCAVMMMERRLSTPISASLQHHNFTGFTTFPISAYSLQLQSILILTSLCQKPRLSKTDRLQHKSSPALQLRQETTCFHSVPFNFSSTLFLNLSNTIFERPITP